MKISQLVVMFSILSTFSFVSCSNEAEETQKCFNDAMRANVSQELMPMFTPYNKDTTLELCEKYKGKCELPERSKYNRKRYLEKLTAAEKCLILAATMNYGRLN